MLQPAEITQLTELLAQNWPNHRNITTYSRHCQAVANREEYNIEEVLDAVIEHRLDDEGPDDTVRGNHPPQPADIKRQVRAGRQRRRDEQASIDVQHQLDEQKAVAQAIEKKQALGIPSMPLKIAQYATLVCKRAAHLKGHGKPLTPREEALYIQWTEDVKPEPVAPRVQAYWTQENPVDAPPQTPSLKAVLDQTAPKGTRP